jgi:pimeloyl-ACP methyl ester carboxylesterase
MKKSAVKTAKAILFFTFCFLSFGFAPGLIFTCLPVQAAEIPDSPVVYWAQTPDGWELAIHRYQPDPVRENSVPVLMVNGLGANRYNFESDDRHSMARFLAHNGLDVWIAECRGMGMSRRSDGKSPDYLWSFEDFILTDIPAILEKVKAETRAPQLDWVGHSMGGMELYGYLERGDAGLIRRGVAVASPVSFRIPNDILASQEKLSFLMKIIDRVPVKQLINVFLLFHMEFGSTFSIIQFNQENMDRDFVRQLAPKAVENLPTKLLLQFSDAIQDEGFAAHAGDYDYASNLSRIKNPILLVAGSLDNLVSPARVLEVLNGVGSPRKEMIVAGRGNGFRRDYGHIDLLIGETAREEIFPLVLNWLIKP